MHLLGHNLAEHKVLRVALRAFYGISHSTSARLLARLQIHHECLVSELTEPQVTALSAYLSSPSTTPSPARTVLSIPTPPSGSLQLSPIDKGKGRQHRPDPLDNLKIETELRRSMLADLAHQRQIGTYKGKRMAQGFPVRGQRTKTNANTAGRLNRIERRTYTTTTTFSTPASPAFSQSRSHPFSSSRILSALRNSS